MPKRKYTRRVYKKRRGKGRKGLFLFLKITGATAFVILLAGFFAFIFYSKDLPRPEKFSERRITEPTKIYDREGKTVLYEIYGEEKRTLIALEQTPELLRQAVIAAEDANFYSHFGLDPQGIARALLANLKLRQPAQGASTISQQLIRSSFLTLEKTAERKIREIILTLELERRYSKDEILEFYLNQVPFGSNAYGVEAASQTYFDKPAQDLSLPEAAVLAALIQAPSRLSPYGPNLQELMERKDYVLERMAQEHFIALEEKEVAQKEEIQFSQSLQPIKAPHFVMYIRNYLFQKYGEEFLKTNGLKVFSTIDWELQELAEKTVREGSRANEGYDAHNASLAAINPKTGEILALVGSKDYFAEPYPEDCSPGLDCVFEPKVNVAVFGQGRQPGSAFKPFAYAAAFQKDLTPETVVWDAKTEFNSRCEPDGSQEEKDEYELDCYHPANYDEIFRGPVTLRAALSQSVNVPSVKVLYLAGVKKTIDLAKTLGITTLDKPLSWYGLSLVLGGGEVKLLDIVSAYGVFAAEGLKLPPIGILKIEDGQGNIVEENSRSPIRVLEPQVANLINSVLSDNEARSPMFGLYSPLYIPGYDVAAKTGTTQDYRDAWTIGYSPTLSAGVWVGNNNNETMDKQPGVMLSSPMWHKFMKEALTKFPKEEFTEPSPIETENPALKGEVLEPYHSILHHLDREDDVQYPLWEYGVSSWLDSTSTRP